MFSQHLAKIKSHCGEANFSACLDGNSGYHHTNISSLSHTRNHYKPRHVFMPSSLSYWRITELRIGLENVACSNWLQLDSLFFSSGLPMSCMSSLIDYRDNYAAPLEPDEFFGQRSPLKKSRNLSTSKSETDLSTITTLSEGVKIGQMTYFRKV